MIVSPKHRYIVGMRVDAPHHEEAAGRILSWARNGESRYVCVGTVHMVMEANDDPSFRRVVNEADLVTPDGMPLVWGLRLLGVGGASRVPGSDLTPVVCRAAAEEGVPVGFYGGTPQTLERLVARLRTDIPALRIAYAYSPPFRPSSDDEEARQVEAIVASGCRVLFVGLGCPKQERWMARMQGRIPAVMLGVGAAFDFLAGTKRKAPTWMQRAGLEWLFRLAEEPRRLWRRYLLNNPRFLMLFSRQLVAERTDPNGGNP